MVYTFINSNSNIKILIINKLEKIRKKSILNNSSKKG